MKELYNSENKLKNGLEGFQAPFDNEAFEKFKHELDKEQNKKKFFWWIVSGKIVMEIFILGLIIFGSHFYLNSNTMNIPASTIMVQPDSTLIQEEENSKPIVAQPEVKNNDSKNNISKIEHNDIESISLLNSNNNIDNFSTRDIVSKTKANEIQTDIFGMVNPSTTKEKSTTNDLIYEKSIIASDLYPEQNKINLLSMLEGVSLLNILSFSKIERNSKNELPSLNIKIQSPIKKYKKHFYFNIGGGITKEDNYGPADEFFELYETNELFWKSSIAYQVNPSTSFQLAFMQKNITLGFRLKDYVYQEKLGSKVSIISATMINKLWSPSEIVDLNFTNGVSIIMASKYFNDFSDFSNTYQGAIVPSTITNFETIRTGLYSKNHFLYSSGLSLDYKLSNNLEFTFGAEYTFGFKRILVANLNYIEGEGVIKNVESSSNGSFASLSFGIKYRLRRE